jgi:hypothetical protein
LLTSSTIASARRSTLRISGKRALRAANEDRQNFGCRFVQPWCERKGDSAFSRKICRSGNADRDASRRYQPNQPALAL